MSCVEVEVLPLDLRLAHVFFAPLSVSWSRPWLVLQSGFQQLPVFAAAKPWPRFEPDEDDSTFLRQIYLEVKPQ